MSDPYYDDPYDTDIDYMYDEYDGDDEWYEDDWYFVYDRSRRSEAYYPNGIIEIEEYYQELSEAKPFWTRRRIIIAIIAILMITAFLAPTALQISRAFSSGASNIPTGPTPTALPSI